MLQLGDLRTVRARVVRNSWSRVLIVPQAAKMWRPHIDDVDRLSRGESAKIKGTGCRDIPHRLNAQEQEIYRAAKKKGYLAVRGTGFRRERKGNPLPNIFRQWCDAKAAPCVVIEQDVLGGLMDKLVIDLTPLRLLSTEEVRRKCLEIAASNGVRHVEFDDHCATIVIPFNILPLPSSSFTLKSDINIPEGENQDQQVGDNEAVAMDQSYANLAMSSTGNEAAYHDLEARYAELLQQLEYQKAAVRTAKESGRGNTDPEVQQLVKELIQLKGAVSSVQDAISGMRAQAIIQRQQAASSRRAALFDAFSTDEPNHPIPSLSPNSSSCPDVPSPHNISEDLDPREDCLNESPGEGCFNKSAGPGKKKSEDAFIASDAARDQTQDLNKATPKGLVSPDNEHPYYSKPIWQLPAEPLIFEADRTTAKIFARQIVEELYQRELAHWL